MPQGTCAGNWLRVVKTDCRRIWHLRSDVLGQWKTTQYNILPSLAGRDVSIRETCSSSAITPYLRRTYGCTARELDRGTLASVAISVGWGARNSRRMRCAGVVSGGSLERGSLGHVPAARAPAIPETGSYASVGKPGRDKPHLAIGK